MSEYEWFDTDFKVLMLGEIALLLFVVLILLLSGCLGKEPIITGGVVASAESLPDYTCDSARGEVDMGEGVCQVSFEEMTGCDFDNTTCGVNTAPVARVCEEGRVDCQG